MAFRKDGFAKRNDFNEVDQAFRIAVHQTNNNSKESH